MWLKKTSSDGTCLGESPGSFYDISCCCCCCCFRHGRFLRFQATFPCHRHFTLASQAREDLQQLWTLPWILSVALLFARLFRHSFTAGATVFEWAFFTQKLFLPYALSPTLLAHFVTQVRAGTPHPGSSSVPTLTDLSLPADAWTWTIHIVVTRPLIYQLRQWATKYRVKIKLLNMFHLFKVYVKTIKTLWTRLDKKYCLKLLRQNCTSKLFWKSSHPESSQAS